MSSFSLSASRVRFLLVVTFISSLLFSVSCGKGSTRNIKIPGVTGPTLTLTEDALLISVVFETLQIDAGFRYKIPKYANSFVEIGPDSQSDGTLFAASLDLDDLYDRGLPRKLDPQTLPGGRPLPGVTSGSLPAVAFSIEKLNNVVFYIGPDVFGLFLPKSMEMEGSIATFRFYVSKKRVGNLSLVGNDDNGENGGFLLLLDLKVATKKKLKKLAKKIARRNKRRRR